ncbi:MAG: redox-regulated ATPase YchF [Thermodesulfovibrionales bacterium]|nr:redox-regulated ATPase YchF [Thermodesulfovibrionales bacterium]
MKIAITGLSNSGKTTLFNALTAQNHETTTYPNISGEPLFAVVKVPDERVDKLSEIYKPKKTTYATVNYIDYIGLTKGDIEQNRKVFDHIKDADAVVIVLRAFKDDSIVHPLNNIDPISDLETIHLEFIFGDLDLVEKRLTRITEGEKKGKKSKPLEKEILLKCKSALEHEIPLNQIDFNNDEKETLRHLQFITTKPQIVVINLSENDLNTYSASDLENKTKDFFNTRNITRDISVLSLSAKVEMEVSQLDTQDRLDFLKDLKINEPACNKLIKTSYELLGMISFLTCGEDEVRAWTIKQGDTALKAAGKIHSDIERGFIRAEVIGFEDFIKSGYSMTNASKMGLLRLEGKGYEVKDGDIIHFRFNV